MAKVCYYCGATLHKGNKSKEHIPPKMMFKPFDCDAVTVPACNLHNSSKAGQDQAIISGFMQSLDAIARKGGAKLTPNIRKAIRYKSAKTFQRTKRIVELRQLVKELPELVYVSLPTINWIRQITAGWVFSATNSFDSIIDWTTTAVHSHSWFPPHFENLSIDELKTEAEKLMGITYTFWESHTIWERGWSPYPGDIYRFFVSFDDEKHISMKHRFYSSFTWYIEFNCSPSTRTALIDKIHSKR